MLVIFDLNGTLTDPAPIGAAWGMPDLGGEALALAVQSAMTDTILGEYHEFTDHLRSALSTLVTQRRLDDNGIEDALQQAGTLPARPEAPKALELFSQAGCRLAVLTNSGAAAGRSTLETAGLAERFEHILGVDAVRRFKPHPLVYQHALRVLESEPGNALLVAAHAWDVWGAKHSGLRTAWIDADERAFPSAAPAPDIVAADLLGAARKIISVNDAAR